MSTVVKSNHDSKGGAQWSVQILLTPGENSKRRNPWVMHGSGQDPIGLRRRMR